MPETCVRGWTIGHSVDEDGDLTLWVRHDDGPVVEVDLYDPEPHYGEQERRFIVGTEEAS